MAHFGLDIGTNTTKIVQLQKENGEFRLVSAAITKTPSPGLASESEKDLIAVAEAIKKLKNEAGISSLEVVSSLPESNVFTRVIELPPMTEEEVAQALHWEIEEIVPIPLSEASHDWQIVRQTSSGTSVLVAVAPKVLIEKYLHIFELSDLRPIALETEVLALVRALNSVGPTKTKLIVEFGAKSVSLVVTKADEIILTLSLPTAGEAITRSISTSLSLEETMAEEYKKTYGLMADQFEGKIKGAVQPVLKLVIDEIKKSLDYAREEKKETVDMIVLSGGGASLPDLSETVAKEIGLEVVIADPFLGLKAEKITAAGLRELAPTFTIAVGLAMRVI